MQNGQSSDGPGESAAGIFSAVAAFLIWGLSPIYYKAVGHVPAFEVLLHRMVWSFLLLICIVATTGRGPELRGVVTDLRRFRILVFTALLVSSNWFVFIWAIHTGRILHTSLGYYINPLVNVLLAMIFLKERLRRAQALAVVLAAVGVLLLTVEIGRLPWISLYLAVSFGFYGLIRKTAPVNAIVGLTVETLLQSVPAGAYLLYLQARGLGAFGHAGLPTAALLVCAALVTAVPLVLFTAGARQIRFTTVGLLQYIAPSCTFLLAVFVYREPFTGNQLLTFVLIWTALGIYTFDMVCSHRRTGRQKQAAGPGRRVH
jgi:chloramphenicol-sensitive protein RarD